MSCSQTSYRFSITCRNKNNQQFGVLGENSYFLMGCSERPQRDKINLIRYLLCIVYQLVQLSVQNASPHLTF